METKNLRSEAAIRRVIKGHGRHRFEFGWSAFEPVIIVYKISTKRGYIGTDVREVAEIDLRKLVKKRKPKIGAEKKVGRIRK